MARSSTLTEGNIYKKIIFFALPLILGNIFQQLYSSVDAAIVGNCVDASALAAVGAGTALVDMLLGFSVGISAGAGVLISRYYGMQDREKVKISCATSIIIGAFIGVVLTIFGTIFIKDIYILMKTPEDILDAAIIYMKIYFAGILFVVLYNMATAILSAAGNSKWSLIFLVISSVINIILDFLFVVLFKMGVPGAAIATVISQAIACFLIFVYLSKVDDIYRIKPRDIKLDLDVLKQVTLTSLPTGIQNTVKAFSNVLIQASVNIFGASAMAGYISFMKIDGFNWLPVMSLSLAASTFTSQNLGAGKNDRVKKGVMATVIICIAYTTITAIIACCLPNQLLSIFTKDRDVIDYGRICLYMFMPFYGLLGVFQILLGAIRGYGNTFASLILNTAAMCVFRIAYISIINAINFSFVTVILIYPLSWVVGIVITIIYYKIKYAGGNYLL